MSQAEKPNSTSRLSAAVLWRDYLSLRPPGWPLCRPARHGSGTGPIYALIEAHREAILAFGPGN